MRELKVGDKFVVVSKPVDDDEWIEEMNEFLKETLTVCSLGTCRGNKYYSCGEWWWYENFIDWETTEKLYSDNDTVNSPSHYCTGAVETIESIKNIVTGNPSVFQGYMVGNVIKYVSRYHKKGGAEDIKKAIKYLEFVLKDIEDEEKQV